MPGRYFSTDCLNLPHPASAFAPAPNALLSRTALDLNVNSNSERGLLGIALDPNFATNGFTYLYYSLSTGAADSAVQAEWSGNRLSRFTFNFTTSQLGSETILQSFPSDAAQANGPNHDGGPLMFGPDNKLYGITGDLNRSRLEQNQGTTATASSSVGGLFRLETTGAPAAGNPFISNPSTAIQRWYAYGIRNSFGLAVDPVTGAIWDTENGPESYDEINRVAAGFNSGWSDIMGPDGRDPQGLSDLVMLPGAHYSDPEFSILAPLGITDLEFLADFTFDANYENAVIFGGSNGTNAGRLHMLRLNEARDGFALAGGLADLVADNAAERDALLFGSGFGATTDIQVGPDHAVYVLSLSNGTLYRIAPLNPSFVLGDMDGNGIVDNFDIRDFELALTDGQAYLAAHPTLGNYKMRGDVNGDGIFDNFDIRAFEELLTSSPAAVPEPSAMLLALGGGSVAMLFAWRRRHRP